MENVFSFFKYSLIFRRMRMCEIFWKEISFVFYRIILSAFDLILIGKEDFDKMIWTINNGEE